MGRRNAGGRNEKLSSEPRQPSLVPSRGRAAGRTAVDCPQGAGPSAPRVPSGPGSGLGLNWARAPLTGSIASSSARRPSLQGSPQENRRTARPPANTRPAHSGPYRVLGSEERRRSRGAYTQPVSLRPCDAAGQSGHCDGPTAALATLPPVPCPPPPLTCKPRTHVASPRSGFQARWAQIQPPPRQCPIPHPTHTLAGAGAMPRKPGSRFPGFCHFSAYNSASFGKRNQSEPRSSCLWPTAVANDLSYRHLASRLARHPCRPAPDIVIMRKIGAMPPRRLVSRRFQASCSSTAVRIDAHDGTSLERKFSAMAPPNGLFVSIAYISGCQSL